MQFFGGYTVVCCTASLTKFCLLLHTLSACCCTPHHPEAITGTGNHGSGRPKGPGPPR
jgi:hypothetical protein